MVSAQLPGSRLALASDQICALSVPDMTPAPYVLPLRIRKSSESFSVEDAYGVALAAAAW